MHTLIETFAEFAKFDKRSKELAGQVVSGVAAKTVSQIIPANSEIITGPDGDGRLLRIREGNLTYQLNGKKLFVLEADDIIGFENILPGLSGVYSSDFAVIVDNYNIQDIYNACKADEKKFKSLTEYLQVQVQLLTGLVSSSLKTDVELAPVFRNFSPGEVIIEQDAQAGEVYTLVEGSAEAFVDGVKVGEISRDEIFGMIAAFTGTPRTATVKAATRCMVLSVPLEKFIDLINSRPQTVLKLLEDMSRMIVGLNNKLVGSKG